MPRKRKVHIRGMVAAVSSTLFLFFPYHIVHGTTFGNMEPEVRVFNSRGSLVRSFLAYDPRFKGGVRVAVGDVTGDGSLEIVTAPGPGGGPEIRIFSEQGTLLNRFYAYGRGYRGGVNITTFDLDHDGKEEIITGPGSGGGPEVKVFGSDGTKRSSFFAFDSRFHGGVNVAAGSFGARGEALIATGSGYGSSHVRLFTPHGTYAGVSLRPFGRALHGVVVASIARPGKRSQLMVGPQRSREATIKVYDLSSLKAAKRTIKAFTPKFRGGVQLASVDHDSDGDPTIIVTAGSGGGPHVQVITSVGAISESFMAYDTSFRGGVSIAAREGMLVTGPGAVFLDGRSDLFKYIEVDLSDQLLKFYTNGKLIGTHQVSTGKWTTPTPIGMFAIKNRIPLAYSKPYDLYMEWWMAFSPDGSYGVHALPYWKSANGGKRYEGVGHLGTPVSHGCIRQTLREARELFAWADIGTPVIVKR